MYTALKSCAILAKHNTEFINSKHLTTILLLLSIFEIYVYKFVKMFIFLGRKVQCSSIISSKDLTTILLLLAIFDKFTHTSLQKCLYFWEETFGALAIKQLNVQDGGRQLVPLSCCHLN